MCVLDVCDGDCIELCLCLYVCGSDHFSALQQMKSVGEDAWSKVRCESGLGLGLGSGPGLGLESGLAFQQMKRVGEDASSKVRCELGS